jgi:hypothetical protein
MGNSPCRAKTRQGHENFRKLDGLRRRARGEAVTGDRLRNAGVPGRALGLQKIEIMQRGRCNQRAVDGMEGNALLERVRSRLALERLRQLILCVRERMQLRRLLGEQHHNGEQQALQRACAPIENNWHKAILVHLGGIRYFARHCFNP